MRRDAVAEAPCELLDEAEDRVASSRAHRSRASYDPEIVDARATPVFVGRVWMNGDPWLVADRADAETWTGADGDYERIIALAMFATEVEVGEGSGLVLSSDYDDGSLEVFRVSDEELLFIGVRYADEEPYAAFLADAVGVDLEVSGTMQVRSGHVAVLASALPWRDGNPVAEQPMPVPELAGVPREDILVLQLRAGHCVLSERHIDRETYGLAVWRLRGVAPRVTIASDVVSPGRVTAARATRCAC